MMAHQTSPNPEVGAISPSGARSPSPAPLNFADHSQVEMLGLRYKFVNFRADKTRANQNGEPR